MPLTAMPVIYVDVDDTLVRTFGTKRMPIPAVVRAVRALFEQGHRLYCWSSGGAEYARTSAAELGIEDCFTGFLPKPDMVLDDQEWSDSNRLRWVHPNQVDSLL